VQYVITNTATILMEEYTTYDLHHNPRDKMRLTHFTVERTCDGGHVQTNSSGIPVEVFCVVTPCGVVVGYQCLCSSSIPDITHAGASPIGALNQQHKPLF